MQIDLDTIVARVSELVSTTDTADPLGIRFLLSQYAATGRDDLSTIVGAALGRAVQQPHALPEDDRTEWLLLFADAAAWSDDERVRDAARTLLAATDGRAADALEAALRAAAALGNGVRLSAAVDDLERTVARGYEPGDGVAAADQFAVASALLTAFDITGRLPYAMLAEELVQTERRRGFASVGGAEAGCRAARVLCRLAALHRDEEYLSAAVIAPDADYRGDATRLLDEYAARAVETPRAAALYGLALAQWLGLH